VFLAAQSGHWGASRPVLPTRGTPEWSLFGVYQTVSLGTWVNRDILTAVLPSRMLGFGEEAHK
jgi:hypothetical protein